MADYRQALTDAEQSTKRERKGERWLTDPRARMGFYANFIPAVQTTIASPSRESGYLCKVLVETSKLMILSGEQAFFWLLSRFVESSSSSRGFQEVT